MIPVITQRVFKPGTVGWTVDDLSEPDIQWQWSQGRFELVDGVLTEMPPQGLEGIDPLSNLRRLLERHLDTIKLDGIFHNEVDVLLRRGRIARPDMIFLTADQRQQQRHLQAKRKLAPGKYHPVYVTPHLVVESTSIGHEDHDRVTKREWYAAAGVPHYWILTAHERSLVCLILDGLDYVEESSNVAEAVVKSQIFGGTSIALGNVWNGR